MTDDDPRIKALNIPRGETGRLIVIFTEDEKIKVQGEASCSQMALAGAALSHMAIKAANFSFELDWEEMPDEDDKGPPG